MSDTDEDKPASAYSIFDKIIETSCLDDWRFCDKLVEFILENRWYWRYNRRDNSIMGYSENVDSVKMVSQKNKATN